MKAEDFGSLILTVILVVIVVVVVVYLLRWLFRRSTKETAFVRTGFLGEKVVINSGAFVIPVLHDITPVNMNVMRIEVIRGQKDALITKNRMRVDIIAEFFVRVKPDTQSVAAAAQTLGRRSLDTEDIRDLLEGKFVSAMRAVAASMTLEEMHEKRAEYMQAVRENASEALSQNGLELETVALADLDQTSTEFFDPTNVFDAEGLTQLTETIEARRKQRNDVEQQTMVQIRTRNLDTERKVLEIDRESEYARIEQDRELQIRRAVQESELAREKALREQEAEQSQIAAREEVEKSRMAHERALAESRIANEEDTQRREIARRKNVDHEEIQTQREVESERIAMELELERIRIARSKEQEQLEVARKREVEVAERERDVALATKALDVTAAQTTASQAEIQANLELESSKILQEQSLDKIRNERERALQTLQIEKRSEFEQAEIVANEAIEKSRIETQRILDEARIALEQEVKTLTVEQEKTVEIAEIDRTIAVSEKSKQRSAAQADADTARAQAIEAEEKVFTAREKEIATRRKMIELIATAQEVEREGLRITARADAEKQAAQSFAEIQLTEAQARADSDRLLAEVAKIRYEIDAQGQRGINEAENVLSESARGSLFKRNLLDKIEGIVRESVRPMEKIDGINILHVDGLNGAGGGSEKRNVTDEIMDSALRYRVQGPLIDNLMKDVGIEGGSIGGMTEVLRNARDLDSLQRNRAKSDSVAAVEDHRASDADRDDRELDDRDGSS